MGVDNQALLRVMAAAGPEPDDSALGSLTVVPTTTHAQPLPPSTLVFDASHAVDRLRARAEELRTMLSHATEWKAELKLIEKMLAVAESKK